MFADTRPLTRPAHRARPHAFLAAALACLFAVAIPTQALAAGGDLVWVFQGIEDVNCADEIMDQNSDGVRDIVLETFDSGATGDNLVCLSGGASGPTAVVIWSTQPPGGPSSSGGYGDECVKVCPDLNGDLIEDVLLGTAWGGRTAYGIDGTDGSVIWDFDTYVDEPPTPPESGWIYTICSIPDIDMDTFPDVFFGCGSYNDHVYHMSGRDGAHLWSLNLGDAIFATAPLNDVNFDGKADVAVGVGDDAPAVWCMRGGATTVPTIWHKVMPSVVWTIGRIADISGDGINDVAVGTLFSSNFVYYLDGADGTILDSFNYGTPVDSIAAIPDVVGDDSWEVAVGGRNGLLTVYSGGTGVDHALADLNGDGQVNAVDLALLLGAWGPCSDECDCPADLDGNGTVGAFDLAILLGAWGP